MINGRSIIQVIHLSLRGVDRTDTLPRCTLAFQPLLRGARSIRIRIHGDVRKADGPLSVVVWRTGTELLRISRQDRESCVVGGPEVEVCSPERRQPS